MKLITVNKKVRTGLRKGRCTWRRRRWHMLAGVDGLQINQLISC